MIGPCHDARNQPFDKSAYLLCSDLRQSDDRNDGASLRLAGWRRFHHDTGWLAVPVHPSPARDVSVSRDNSQNSPSARDGDVAPREPPPDPDSPAESSRSAFPRMHSAKDSVAPTRPLGSAATGRGPETRHHRSSRDRESDISWRRVLQRLRSLA